jgi:hypothetical protein
MSHIKKPMKQIAGITIKSFNPNNIESDLDTIRSDLVRNKINEFKEIKPSNSINTGKIFTKKGVYTKYIIVRFICIHSFRFQIPFKINRNYKQK